MLSLRALLSRDIEKKYETKKESYADIMRKQSWYKHMKRVAEECYPELQLILAGSTSSGFATKGSDCDFTLLPRERSRHFYRLDVLRKIERSLRSESDGSNLTMQLVSSAVVPILILKDRSRDLEGDISYDVPNTIYNTFLMRCYGDMDPRVKPLVIVIKAWAQQAGITNAREHKLSGFAVVLLILSYLQVGCRPRVLPSLQQDPQFRHYFDAPSAITTAGWLDGGFTPPEVAAYASKNTVSLGGLLVGFFRYYSNFDWRRVLSIRTGGFLSLPYDKKWTNPEIRIEDPHDRHNVTRAVYRRYEFNQICDAFQAAYDDLEDGGRLRDIFDGDVKAWLLS